MAEATAALYFCHGAPGSAEDVNLLPHQHEEASVLAPNLFETQAADPIAAAIQQFDALLADRKVENVHLVGFSIGSMVAMHIAAARPERVEKLTLISPAAPLQLGDFLPLMAGAPVFKLAQKSPILLRGLTALQGVMFRFAPQMLIKQLFANVCPLEKALLSDHRFKVTLKNALANSLSSNPKSYCRFITHYVSDWSPQLADITCPVDIWQGAQDNWSPPTMAHALQDALPNSAQLNLVPEAGHYSTLTKVQLVGSK